MSRRLHCWARCSIVASSSVLRKAILKTTNEFIPFAFAASEMWTG
jgi:hypothetical protein